MMAFLRNMVQHNLLVKLSALAVAVALWLYVMNDQNPSIDGGYTIPVTIEGVPEGYRVQTAGDMVHIRVRGPRFLFVSTDRSDFHASVNLSDFVEGEKMYPVNVSVPIGLELTGITPDKIAVTLDSVAQKKFDVALTVGGAPATGVMVDGVEQMFDTVTVEGPRTALEHVAHVVAHISIDGQASDFSVTTPLIAVNEDGREVHGLTITPDTTEVKVRLARGLSRKVVAVQAKARSDLSPKLHLEEIAVEPGRIEIAGREELLSGIDHIETVEFSLADVKQTESRQVRLYLPEGVTVTDPNVTVTIKVGAMQ